MYEVRIPDQIYKQAAQAADAQHMSLEEFVAEAVQLHLYEEETDEPSVQLTREQIAIIRKSQAEIKAGKGLTMDQVEKRLASKKAAWLESHQS